MTPRSRPVAQPAREETAPDDPARDQSPPDGPAREESAARLAGLRACLQRESHARGGAVSFREYMELVLHHPEWGYYPAGRTPIGKTGDFITAPELTSLFGELLAVQLVQIWEGLGQPDRFVCVEVGAGTGRMAVDLLAAVERFPRCAAALSYRIVESSPVLGALQRDTLAAGGWPVAWFPTLAAAAGSSGITGVILSNELLDALPVHWVEITPAGLREVATTCPDGVPGDELLIDPRPPLTADHFTRLGIELPVGMRTEIGLAGQEWMTGAAALLARGVILTIDYGYPAREYYHPELRFTGTLTGYRGHREVADPWGFPGEMDLTSQVDFSAIARCGVNAGLTTLGFTTQAWFLMGLGILTRLERLADSGGFSPELRQTAQRLLLPGQMGESFKVLAQGRGWPERLPLLGFGMNDQQRRL